jgi:hypothetical protein
MARLSFRWQVWLGLYVLLLAIYAVFSYGLTAPNLILSNWEPYWNFQTWMWKTFFNNRHLLTYSYIAIISIICLTYVKTLQALRNIIFSTQQLILVTLLLATPLFISNNALSYDVFNYMFNAKMVLVFNADPHQKVALDYAYDDWTRFMHNTHTPAPYGYGWTALSLLPFLAGQEKFTLTWLLFRAMSVMSLIMLALLLGKFTTSKQRWWTYAVLFNPLLLIEVVSNSHNDLWMMVPAVASTLLIFKKPIPWSKAIASLILLLLSATIKFATITLLPIWLIQVFFKSKALEKYWAYLSSLALFSPLLTTRSQQFHPWYLPWSMVWLPWIPKSPWKWGLLALSISSLYRYVPYLWYGEYSPQILFQQKLITWVPWAICMIILIFYNWRAPAK